VPAVSLLPGRQFGLLFVGEPPLPLDVRLSLTLGQRLGRREGAVAGAGDGGAGGGPDIDLAGPGWRRVGVALRCFNRRMARWREGQPAHPGSPLSPGLLGLGPAERIDFGQFSRALVEHGLPLAEQVMSRTGTTWQVALEAP